MLALCGIEADVSLTFDHDDLHRRSLPAHNVTHEEMDEYHGLSWPLNRRDEDIMIQPSQYTPEAKSTKQKAGQ